MANTWGHVYASSSDLIVALICVCWNPGLPRKYVQSLCIKCIFKIMPAIGGAQFLGAPSCVPVWSKATILRPRSLYIMVASLWQHPSRSYSLGSANIHLSRPPVLSSSFPTFWSWWQEFCHPGLSFREPKAASTLGPFGDLGVLLQTSILQLLPGGILERTNLYLSHWYCSPVYIREPHGMMEGNQPAHLTVLRDPNCQLCPQGSSLKMSEHLYYQMPPTTDFGLKDLQHLGHGRLIFVRLISNNKPFPWAPWPFSSWPWYPSSLGGFLMERNRLGYLLLISPHPLFLLCTSLLPIA